MILDEDVDGEEDSAEQVRLRSSVPRELLVRYIIGPRLGHGSGGTVFLGYKKPVALERRHRQPRELVLDEADDETTGKVAIKVAWNTMANLGEAEILRKLEKHPCIIGVQDIFQNEMCSAIVMEYAKGGELFTYVLKDFENDTLCERIAKLQFYQVIDITNHTT